MPTPNITDDMQMMFLRLGLSQMVAEKPVDDQGIDSPQTLNSLSDEDIGASHDVVIRPGGLVGGRMPDS